MYEEIERVLKEEGAKEIKISGSGYKGIAKIVISSDISAYRFEETLKKLNVGRSYSVEQGKCIMYAPCEEMNKKKELTEESLAELIARV